MARLILHKDGVYNVFSSVVDAPLYDNGLTLDELTAEIKEEYGQQGLNALPARLNRAHNTGSSCALGGTLEDTIDIYQANHMDEADVCTSVDSFIRKFLTLPVNPEAA